MKQDNKFQATNGGKMVPMGIIAVIEVIWILYNLIKEGLEPTRKCGTDFDKYFKETRGMTPKQKEKALRSGRYDVPLKW